MPTTPQTTEQRLLICSVGGSPEPVAAAIRHWRPARALFLCSEQARESAGAALAAAESAGGLPVPPGCRDQTVLLDPQDFQQTLRDLRALDRHVRSWQQHGAEYAVVVDFTGGTKVMSAALALAARRWKCTFSYVGGEERSKSGLGVVVSGRERHFHQLNPWDALGYQAVEDAVSVFNHGGYAAAAALLELAVKMADKPDVKRELSTLAAVTKAYAAWDRFDHKEAKQEFNNALKHRNDLNVIFPHDAAALVMRLERHCSRVSKLEASAEPKREWVEDLYDNACRRAAESRWDDAVARLYRAFEAMAQVRLREKYKIPDTKGVPLESLPEPLREEWDPRARDGKLQLGLQDAYALLKALGDDLGTRFSGLGLDHPEKSPLAARNQSVLAHGFRPVGKAAYNQLEQKFVELASMSAAEPMDWSLPASGDAR